MSVPMHDLKHDFADVLRQTYDTYAESSAEPFMPNMYAFFAGQLYQTYINTSHEKLDYSTRCSLDCLDLVIQSVVRMEQGKPFPEVSCDCHKQ